MQTVIGLFDNAHDAQKAADHLKSNGFTDDNVDLTIRNSDSSGSSYATGAMGSNSTSRDTISGTMPDNDLRTSDDTSYTRDDYSTGRSIDADRDYDKRDNDESFGDKVSRFFRNLFGSDDDEQARRYSHVANKTGCLVTVYAQSSDEAERAADILDEYGAINVDESAREYGYSADSSMGVGTTYADTPGDYSSNMTDRDDDYATRTSDRDTDESQKLNVIREDVQVGKREIQTGGVRLRSRIVERPVEEDLRLREERVRVERTPVDRPATTADFQNFKEGEIEMTERAEVADVSKEARVVEEVRLSKEVNERKETIRETARDTQVDVENIDRDDTDIERNRRRDL